MIFRRLDAAALHAEYLRAEPFPHVVMDDFLERRFAVEVAHSIPDFSGSAAVGHRFATVNERKKIQVTDRQHFPEPVQRLSDALHSPAFLGTLTAITGIHNLLVDERMYGGGVHQTARRGRLDVHADFNFIPDVEYFRRLNLLIYLNPLWEEGWGGELELWDEDVRVCHQRLLPILGRCVLFETSVKSFHGTTRVRSPRAIPRSSFALYYYTRESPPGFDDTFQGTVFRARPDERLKGKLLMPLENQWNRLSWHANRLWQRVRGRNPGGHGRTAT